MKNLCYANSFFDDIQYFLIEWWPWDLCPLFMRKKPNVLVHWSFEFLDSHNIDLWLVPRIIVNQLDFESQGFHTIQQT